MRDIGNTDLDTVFDLLSKPRCRYILYYLLENQHMNVERVSRQIAVWEQEAGGQPASEPETETVILSLLHNQLPRLAEHGIIEFDLRSGDAVVTDEFAEFRELVDHARSCDDDITIEGESTDAVLYSDPLKEESVSATSSN